MNKRIWNGWMDGKIKTKEVDISIDDQPKLENIADY